MAKSLDLAKQLESIWSKSHSSSLCFVDLKSGTGLARNHVIGKGFRFQVSGKEKIEGKRGQAC